MKDLGPLKYFLSIEVARNSIGMYLCQQKYTLDILSDAGLLGTKPLSFPMEQNHKLRKATGSILSSPDTYYCLVGRLIIIFLLLSFVLS